MDWTWAAVISGMTLLMSVGVAWGVVRATVASTTEKATKVASAQELHGMQFVELKTKHEQLAAEVRPQVNNLSTKMQALEVQHARFVEGMEGINRQLAEIKGMLNALLKREIEK